MSDNDLIRRGDALNAMTKTAVAWGVSGEPAILIATKNAIAALPPAKLDMSTEGSAVTAPQGVDVMVKAADWLSICAQSTGGTAGRDDGLVAAIDAYANARAALAPAQPAPSEWNAAIETAADVLGMWGDIYGKNAAQTVLALRKGTDHE